MKRLMHLPRWSVLWLAVFLSGSRARAADFEGLVVDAESGDPLAARVYLRSADGNNLHVEPATPEGAAVPYDVRRSPNSLEVHTCVSAHPFRASLAPGEYVATIERGKEYFPLSESFQVTDGEATRKKFRLRRWIDMAEGGWYSGDTHVHRRLSELPTVLLAEDLNVALPLTAWVTDTTESPSTSNKNSEAIPPADLIEVDPTHVIWPVNTEYEIFTVNRRSHTLGAVFVLNHREPLSLTAPPVGPIAAEARRQGAILDLDKHNWPWSMMLVERMKVDLFELTNNHVWRTDFLYADWYPEYAAEYMNIKMTKEGFTEEGWIDFGFKNYYALLNCGFDLKPTAGTASGVHPVPLGFGRVYVQVGGDFTYGKWIAGLTAGHSFVTTGPMLLVDVEPLGDGSARIRGRLNAALRPECVEVIVNGAVSQTITSPVSRTDEGAFLINIDLAIPVPESSWIAVRAFVPTESGRVTFAHTAPVHIDIPGKPLRPTRKERDYLVRRVADEIQRNQGVISEAALEEYRAALESMEALPFRE